MSYDFSFKNPEIGNWFAFEPDSEPPVRQFMYIHEHPLIRPNFITELELEIYAAGQHMMENNIRGSAAVRLERFARDFTRGLESFVVDRSEENALPALEAMRNLRKLCSQVKGL